MDIFQIITSFLSHPALTGISTIITIMVTIWNAGRKGKGVATVFGIITIALMIITIINIMKPTPSVSSSTPDNVKLDALADEAIQIGSLIREEAKKLTAAQQALAVAKKNERDYYAREFERLSQEIEKRSKDRLVRYGAIFIQLEQYDRMAVSNAFEKAGNQSLNKQLRVVGIIQQHYQQFLANGGLNVDQWANDFRTF